MLKEWISNLSIETLRQIAQDNKAQGSHVWQLAVHELLARESRQPLAA